MQNWLSTRSAKKGWRSILQSLPDDLFATDLQGRIKFVSQRMIDLSSVDGTLQCIRSQAGIFFDPQFEVFLWVQKSPTRGRDQAT